MILEKSTEKMIQNIIKGTTPVQRSSNADVSNKLGTATVGSSSLPIYLNEGLPTQCGGSLSVSITGNSATATKLATAREFTIGAAAAKSFDGTANLTWSLADIGAATAAQGAKADTAYQKPSSGIPKADLENSVQTSLQKADTALQSVPDATTSVKGIVLLGAAGGAARYGQKADVGLGNVDNTSDANKPISTATQTALDSKLDKITSTASLGRAYIVTAEGTQSNLTIDNGASANSLAKRDSDGRIYVGSPTDASHATPKSYVDTAAADAKSAGTTAQTNLTTHINNKSNPHGVTYSQVGAAAANHSHSYIPLAGGTITGVIKPNATNTIDLGASGTVFKTVYATTFSGNATSASKLNTNAGSSTQPVYFSGGVPVACGGTLGVSISGNAATATKLGTTNVGSSTKPIYLNGGTPTACGNSLGVSITGNAATATTLATARSLSVNLASTTAASFNGSANASLGITGTLAIAHGGTGATSAQAAANSLLASLTAVTTLASSDWVIVSDSGNIRRITVDNFIGSALDTAYTATYTGSSGWSSSTGDYTDYGKYMRVITAATHGKGTTPRVETFLVRSVSGSSVDIQTYDSPMISSNGDVRIFTNDNSITLKVKIYEI